METNAAMHHPSAPTPSLSVEQMLIFEVADQRYALAATQIQEIREWSRVTPLPNSPRYVAGMLNLRGAIVPVFDIRLRLGLPAVDHGPQAVIIIVKIDNRMTGFIADTVSDVIPVEPNQRRRLPDVEGATHRQFMDGLIELDNRLVILLKAEKLIESDNSAALSPLSPAASHSQER